MKSRTEELSPEVIQAVTHSAQVQDNGSSNWLTALTDDPSTLTLDSTVLEKPPTYQIDKTNLAQAQEQDRVIGQVRYYLKSSLRPTAQKPMQNCKQQGSCHTNGRNWKLAQIMSSEG